MDGFSFCKALIEKCRGCSLPSVGSVCVSADEELLVTHDIGCSLPHTGVDENAAKMPGAKDCAQEFADLVLNGTDAKVCMSPRVRYGLYSSNSVTGSGRAPQSRAQCVEMSTSYR